MNGRGDWLIPPPCRHPPTQGPFLPSVVDMSALPPVTNNGSVPFAPLIDQEEDTEVPEYSEEQVDQLHATAMLQPAQSQHIQALREARQQ